MTDEREHDVRYHALEITIAFGFKSRLVHLKYWGKKELATVGADLGNVFSQFTEIIRLSDDNCTMLFVSKACTQD